MGTVGDLLRECLGAAGITRVHDDPLLADAAGRLGNVPGAALFDGRLRLSSRPGGAPSRVKVDDAADLADAVASAVAAATGDVSAAVEIDLALDMDAPAPPGTRPVPVTQRVAGPPPHLEDGVRTVVLAGPGVVRAGHVDGLRAFAAARSLGVANSWGAKGVFVWNSPHHMGTAGLQADDFALLGFADAELILATGVDPDEADPARWALAPVTSVDPSHLAALATTARAARPIPPNDLYTGLAAVVQRFAASDQVPLAPVRAVTDVRAALPAGGIAAADPGPAGLWVARTFPTSELGSVVVPATVVAGFAAAAAFVAGLDGRRAVAVTTGPVDDATALVVERARREGVPLVLDVWGSEGGTASSDAHRAALVEALAAGGVHVLHTAVDFTHTAHLLDVAGPVTAWGGLGGQ